MILPRLHASEGVPMPRVAIPWNLRKASNVSSLVSSQ